MLRGYWDESGHSADPACKYVGMAGLVATDAGWAACTSQWQAALHDFGLSFFHMRAFRNKDAWPAERRRELSERLVGAIRAAEPRLLGAVVSLDGWRALLPEVEQLFLDPYFACLQEVARLALILADTVGDDRIAMILSQQTEYAGRAELLWDALSKSELLPIRRLASVRSADMRVEIPLQCADFVAYEAVRAAPELMKGADMDLAKIRGSFAALLSIDRFAWLSGFDYEDLRAQCANARGGRDRHAAT